MVRFCYNNSLGGNKMQKILCLLCALVIAVTVLPLWCFAAKDEKSEKVELYGNKISVNAKQICFVKGTEENDSLYGSHYGENFKKYYYVGENTVDIKEVAEKLPKLQNLVVISSDVKNVSALKELDDLVWLGFYQCDGTEDLSFLKNLTGLKKFRYKNIYGEKECESIKPVAKLKNLTELYLYVRRSATSDIASLKGLTKLKKLDIRYIDGESVSALKNFKALKELSLRVSGKVDMSFLSSLKNLRMLDISGDTKNLDTAVKLEKLKDLRIDSSGDDLSFIGKMTWLEKLSLSYVNKSFADSLGSLTKLNELSLTDINNGRSYSMDFLPKLESLETLFIFGNLNLDITGISKLSKLKTVSVWLSEFRGLSELKKCKALEKLVIYNNDSPFDINWIAGSNIGELWIAGGSIKNMEKLGTLKKMKKLMLDFTGISDETAKAIKKALPKCEIEVCELGHGDYIITKY